MSGELTFDEALHKYHLDGIERPSVSQIISLAGLYGKGKSFFTPDSALRGTRCHKATELYDRGTLDRSSVAGTKLDKHLEAWINAIGDMEAGIVENEIRFSHEMEGVIYAGTCDRVLELRDGSLAIADLKTGKKIGRPHGAQTQAYRLGLEQLLGREIQHAMCIHTRDTGTYKIENYSDPEWQALWVRTLRKYKEQSDGEI